MTHIHTTHASKLLFRLRKSLFFHILFIFILLYVSVCQSFIFDSMTSHYFLAHRPISARFTNDDYSNGFGSESRMSHQPFIISNSVKNSCFWDLAKLQIILKLIQFPNKRQFRTFAKYRNFVFAWKFRFFENS